jgi:hypothetical protein
MLARRTTLTFCQRIRDGPSDPPASASDEDKLVGEVECQGHDAKLGSISFLLDGEGAITVLVSGTQIALAGLLFHSPSADDG